MKIHHSTTSTLEIQPLAFALNTRDERSMRPLAERELDYVAAGGSKTGVSGGSGVLTARNPSRTE